MKEIKNFFIKMWNFIKKYSILFWNKTKLFLKKIGKSISIRYKYFKEFLIKPPFNWLLHSNIEYKEKINLYIKQNKIDNLIFYTDKRNIWNILKYGINTISDLTLEKNEKYIVWDYQQKERSISFEFDNTKSTNFNKWAYVSEIKKEDIIKIGINCKKILKDKKKHWYYDMSLNFATLYETVEIKYIDWIFINDDFDLFYKVQKYLIEKKINIILYYKENNIIRKWELNETTKQNNTKK